MGQPVEQQRRAFAGHGRGDLATEMAAGAMEMLQHGFGTVVALGLAVDGRDRHYQPRGVGERRDVHDPQALEHAVAAIGQDLVERDGHLPAELAGLAVGRNGG